MTVTTSHVRPRLAPEAPLVRTAPAPRPSSGPHPVAVRPRALLAVAFHRLGLPGGLPAGTSHRRRHALVVVTGVSGLVAAGLAGTGLLGADGGRPLLTVLAALLVPAALLAVAVAGPVPARLRSAAAAAGLMATCCAAVCLAPSVTEAHFAFFVAAVLLGLYRDAAVFPVALAATLLCPDLADAVSPAHAVAAVAGAGLLHAAFVVAGGAVCAVGWALADASTPRGH